MEAFLTHLLMNSRGLAAYTLIFLVLVACGLGLPVPEDISLVSGGFLSRIGAANLPVMMVVGFAGILCGDTLIYLAGRRIGSRAGHHTGFLAHLITPEKHARVERLFEIHGQKIVMLARFLPGVRAVTFFTAGSAQMHYLRFVFWDGLAALVSAPVFVYLGSRFGNHLRWLIFQVKQGERVVILVLLLVAVVYISHWRYRRRKEAKASPLAAQVGELATEAGVQPASPADAGERRKGDRRKSEASPQDLPQAKSGGSQ